MSIFDHYIPESEQKARYGCFTFIAIAFALLMLVWLGYGFYETVDRQGLNVVSVIGVLIFLVGISLYAREKWSSRNGLKTKGRVVRVEPDEAQPTLEVPIIRFLNKKGAVGNKNLSQSFEQGKFKMGDELKILVVNDEVHLDKSNKRRDGLLIFAGIALVIIGFSIF